MATAPNTSNRFVSDRAYCRSALNSDTAATFDRIHYNDTSEPDADSPLNSNSDYKYDPLNTSPLVVQVRGRGLMAVCYSVVCYSVVCYSVVCYSVVSGRHAYGNHRHKNSSPCSNFRWSLLRNNSLINCDPHSRRCYHHTGVWFGYYCGCRWDHTGHGAQSQ